MKKLFSCACAVLLACTAAAVPVSAENGPPFDLTAPEHVTMTYLNGNDSANTIEIAYSQNAEMSKFFSDKETDYDAWTEARNAEGFDDMWVNAQIDWSLDTQDDWHAGDYWTSEGYDADNRQRLGDWAYIAASYSTDISMSEWIFRWMGDIANPEDTTWYGRHEDGDDYNGWKDVLKEDQYEVIEGEDGEKYAKIDFTKHTLYARVRWLLTVRETEGEDRTFASDWSEVASVGKDTAEKELLKPGDIAAPLISDLHYTGEEFNGQPVIAFTLTVDDTLTKQLTQAAGTQGGIWLETEARVQGMTEWRGLQGDWTIKTGEMQIDLLGLEEDAGGKIEAGTPIELRARYCCAQAEQDDFYSDYSEVLVFGAVDMTTPAEESADEESIAEEAITAAPAQETAKKHSLWWLWLLLLLIVIIIVVILVLRSKKKES